MLEMNAIEGFSIQVQMVRDTPGDCVVTQGVGMAVFGVEYSLRPATLGDRPSDSVTLV